MSTFFRFDGSIQNAIGEAVTGAWIYVCTQPNSISPTDTVIPPTPLATIYSDAAGTPLANPVVADGNGNFFFYAATGTYTLVYFDQFGRIPTIVFPDQVVLAPGGGSVTSVALTMPAEFTVSGSPITNSGTLAVSKANENANAIYAGPTSGVPAAPTFRPMVANDLPSGTGTVTSVQATVTPTAPIAASVSGGPITGAGTLAFLISLANQPANTVLAGPLSGGSGVVSARALIPADLPPLLPVSFSATPIFDAAASSSFHITLTADVTSLTIINPTTGQTITFIITQDSAGSHAFAWPSNVKGASGVAGDANLTSVQSFIYDGTNWRATGPGSVAP